MIDIAWALVAAGALAGAWDGFRRWVTAWREKRIDMARVEAVEVELKRIERELRENAEDVAEAKKTMERTVSVGFTTAKREFEEIIRQQRAS